MPEAGDTDARDRAGGDRGAGGDGPVPARPGVAAFDFDGTLAGRDTLVPFLRQARGTPRVALAAARAALRTRDRDALKVAAIGHLFRGVAGERPDPLGPPYVPTPGWLL